MKIFLIPYPFNFCFQILQKQKSGNRLHKLNFFFLILKQKLKNKVQPNASYISKTESINIWFWASHYSKDSCLRVLKLQEERWNSIFSPCVSNMNVIANVLRRGRA